MKVLLCFLLVLPFYSCFEIFETPKNIIVEELQWPGKPYKVVVFYKKGNALTEDALNIFVLEKNQKLSPSEGGNVFIAEFTGEPKTQISIMWEQNGVMEVLLKDSMKIRKSENKYCSSKDILTVKYVP